jgi:translation initiation factor 1
MKSGSGKNKPGLEALGGLVYSTNPNFNPHGEDEEQETPQAGHQKLYVELVRLKGNKLLTVVTGFKGREDDLQQLGKALKSRCGTGGNVKDGEILIQGDMVKKVMEHLQKEGYTVKRKGG